MTNATALFEAILASDQPPDAQALDALFDRLEPVEAAFMLGDWEGGTFNTGHEAEAQLLAINWAGKAFHDAEHVDPIVCRDPDGKRFANKILGSARLRAMHYRGSVTATMIYDDHPIFDHFRKVSDKLVVGAMDRKGENRTGYFFLRRL
ncbi:DUF4334 domain-containing protein [Oleomonas cavernae]|uniref:DUF4334 domain-containing protein n=1 Tax=Oleomonas cavernae TaxID=2320859 RepID=A0A418WCP5_9PROT|nr:DUF4334 domain-containing protein [Oleomonas cavernae]RJF87760.1 DUF4334 domain-containing protein [Oleomonas cavernae]